MSFAAPLHLAALLAIPVLAALFAFERRRRRRYAVRHPAAGTLATMRVPRWRRVLPAALVALAAPGTL